MLTYFTGLHGASKQRLSEECSLYRGFLFLFDFFFFPLPCKAIETTQDQSLQGFLWATFWISKKLCFTNTLSVLNNALCFASVPTVMQPQRVDSVLGQNVELEITASEEIVDTRLNAES